MIYLIVAIGIIVFVKISYNWLLKHGPGSVGESTKVIAQNFRINSNPKLSGRPTDINDVQNIFFCMYMDRASLNLSYPQPGDLILDMNFMEFISKTPFELLLKNGNEDLGIFVLKILFFESSKWRKSIMSISEQSREKIFFTIYSTILQEAPKGLKMSQGDFIKACHLCVNRWRKEMFYF